jgi:hypothetical protein
VCSFGLTWEAQADKPSLGSYYLELGDKLNAVCPSCILLLEGTGQSKFLGVDWCAAQATTLCKQTPKRLDSAQWFSGRCSIGS